MTTPEPSFISENGYVFDSESATEMARLLLQDRLINETMGGLFPKQQNLTGINRILDIGCGPGGWALDVAKNYPHMHVIGIDNSKAMIAHALEEKKLHGLKNIEFIEMDVLKQPLSFHASMFDLINIRNAVGYVPRSAWPALLKECYRITRSGGILRLTEGDSMGLTSSHAYEEHHRLGAQAMQKSGYGFSPDGSTLGITPMLNWLLKQAGYTEEGGMESYTFDFSYGTPLHPIHIQNIEIAFESARPLLLQAGVCGQERIANLYLQVLEQIRGEDFRGIGHLLTAWRKKP